MRADSPLIIPTVKYTKAITDFAESNERTVPLCCPCCPRLAGLALLILFPRCSGRLSDARIVFLMLGSAFYSTCQTCIKTFLYTANQHWLEEVQLGLRTNVAQTTWLPLLINAPQPTNREKEALFAQGALILGSGSKTPRVDPPAW